MFLLFSIFFSPYNTCLPNTLAKSTVAFSQMYVEWVGTAIAGSYLRIYIQKTKSL